MRVTQTVGEASIFCLVKFRSNSEIAFVFVDEIIQSSAVSIESAISCVRLCGGRESGVYGPCLFVV